MQLNVCPCIYMFSLLLINNSQENFIEGSPQYSKRWNVRTMRKYIYVNNSTFDIFISESKLLFSKKSSAKMSSKMISCTVCVQTTYTIPSTICALSRSQRLAYFNHIYSTTLPSNTWISHNYHKFRERMDFFATLSFVFFFSAFRG